MGIKGYAVATQVEDDTHFKILWPDGVYSVFESKRDAKRFINEYSTVDKNMYIIEVTIQEVT